MDQAKAQEFYSPSSYQALQVDTTSPRVVLLACTMRTIVRCLNMQEKEACDKKIVIAAGVGFTHSRDISNRCLMSLLLEPPLRPGYPSDVSSQRWQLYIVIDLFNQSIFPHHRGLDNIHVRGDIFLRVFGPGVHHIIDDLVAVVRHQAVRVNIVCIKSSQSNLCDL